MSESTGMPVGVSVTLSAGAANALGVELAQQSGTEHVPYTESVTFDGRQPVDTPSTGENSTQEAPGPAEAIDANPYRTAQAAETFAISAGVDPVLAKFYGGRIQKALSQPAMTPEAQRQSMMETHQAMIDQFGDEADGYMEVARREVTLLSRDHPNLRAILERTNLGNDMHLIKSLIGRAAEREMKARGFRT
ncbi:hypothetical protein FIV34_04105 [Luteibacter pinisoli]|uniref:Uncharacterized protein n=1 Tax=Luteibacter pinisoli TaxID=2589080 RepID=A0A4Y5YZH9_9GAMM|nr:hypothetical protein [Luteibacter pinisoli]QDE38440.1 hypothetical protein FIV34_04105 [Luteibacter pinisoli]